MAAAIEFNHVGKQYRLGLVSTKTLSHDLNRWWQTAILKKEDPYLKIGEVNDRSIAGGSEYVWALRDIDFKVEQGDVVGIIGKNGAGKSTLLKLLSKVTGPTIGTIRARGRIGSLLEVGTGFHPEMTGRENIYMNGAIMGMTKPEINKKLDEIIDFSGCERYIDTPVKRYSSGMTVRLGFAVAAHLDPDILVVDEVLAVGDAEFQKKAIGKMQDVSHGKGRTVLFVSHNMASIRALCKTGILLDNGMIKRIGEINDVVDTYLADRKFVPDKRIIDSNQVCCRHELTINKITLNGREGNVIHVKYPDRDLHFHIEGYCNQNVKLEFECEIYDMKENRVAQYVPVQNGAKIITLQTNEEFVIDEIIHLPHNICNGQFSLSFELCHPFVQTYARWDNAIQLYLTDYETCTGTNADYNVRGLLNLADFRQ